MQFGPDGALYIVDWYNAVISHNELDIHHKARDKKNGRIWRIYHKSQSRFVPDIKRASNEELINYIQSKRIWVQRAAWQEISQRNAKELIPQLKEIVRNSNERSIIITAIWALESLNYFDYDLWRFLIYSKDEFLRYEAVRSLKNVAPSLNQTRKLLRQLEKEKVHRVCYQIIFYYQNAQDVTFKDWLWLKESFRRKQPTIETSISWSTPAFDWGGPYENSHQNDLLRTAGKVIKKKISPSKYLSSYAIGFDFRNDLSALQTIIEQINKIPYAKLLFESFYEKYNHPEKLSELLKILIEVEGVDFPLLAKNFSSIKDLIIGIFTSNNEQFFETAIRANAIFKTGRKITSLKTIYENIKSKNNDLSLFFLRSIVLSGGNDNFFKMYLDSDSEEEQNIALHGFIQNIKNYKKVNARIQSFTRSQKRNLLNEFAGTKKGLKFIKKHQIKKINIEDSSSILYFLDNDWNVKRAKNKHNRYRQKQAKQEKKGN